MCTACAGELFDIIDTTKSSFPAPHTSNLPMYYYPAASQQIGSQSVHNQSWLETDRFGNKQIGLLSKHIGRQKAVE